VFLKIAKAQHKLQDMVLLLRSAHVTVVASPNEKPGETGSNYRVQLRNRFQDLPTHTTTRFVP